MFSQYIRRITFLFISLVLVTILYAQELPAGKPEDLGFSAERLQRLTSVFRHMPMIKKWREV